MWQTFIEYGWLSLSAFIAGTINAIAGGGTLLTFPALIAVLKRSFGDSAAGVVANCTSTVALVPASFGSAWGFRRELSGLRWLLLWLLPPSVIGGGMGAWLLVAYPDRFKTLIPWLLLTAATVFLLQPILVRRKSIVVVENGKARHADGLIRVPPAKLAGMCALQLLISIYGGYFGAGIGILMLSGFGLMGMTNIHQMNGAKSSLAGVINGVAVAIFVYEGKVYWPFAIAMMGTSIVGGFVGAHFSRQVNGRYVRLFVVAIGFLLAAYFFAVGM
jgi:uncharacterized membrane protein YfcA